MTELVLFGFVGLFAVAFAIAMLMSDNAVHSALFLIGTMGCIALLFLLLNAPFLAMIQITVYTGAIMVLFLFVIMLLGSERLQDFIPGGRRGRWDTRLAVGLIFAFFAIVGIVIAQVNLDLSTETGALPQIRVLNAAPDAGTVALFANDEAVAADVAFRSASDYVTLQPGEYTFRVQPENGEAVTATVTLARGAQQTIVDYGTGAALGLHVVADDNSTVTEANHARLTFFNADPDLTAVRLVDLGSSLSLANAQVLVDSIAPGEASASLLVPESTVNWAFVDAANPQNVVYRLDNYAINRDTSALMVLAQERIFAGASPAGTLRALAMPIVVEAAPAFGGPRAIGLSLFTDYMLVFQLLAVLLLAAMVGAIVLTHRQSRSETRKVTGRRVVSRPLVSVIAAQVGHEVTEEGADAPELQEPAAPVGQ